MITISSQPGDRPPAPPAGPPGTIRAALGYPAFRFLLAGLAVSQIGDWLYNFTLVTLVYQRTGSVMWAGIATGARVLPMVILGPVGGVIADRFDRRYVMVVSDLLRLLLMLALALVAVAGLPIVLAPVIAALATTAGASYLACVSATTPRLVRADDLPGANAGRSAVTSVGLVAGSAIGGLLLLLASPALAFVVNAATFGAALACVLAIRQGPAFTVVGRADGKMALGGAIGSTLHAIAVGAAALRAHPAAIRLVGGDLICSVVYGMQTVMLVLVARQAGLGLHGYGYLLAALGVGGIVGTALASRTLRLPSHLGLALAMGLVGLSMLALPVAHWGVVAIMLACVNGIGAILVEVMTETGLQRMLPPEVFGRAYGLAIPASIAGIVVGSVLAPVLVDTLGLTGSLTVCGAMALAYGLQSLAPLRAWAQWVRGGPRILSGQLVRSSDAEPGSLARTLGYAVSATRAREKPRWVRQD